MVGYIVKRFLWSIPTILIVLIITFLLSRVVKQDPVSALLQLQGIDFGHSQYNKSYATLYKKMSFDLPIFYFSILPHHYHYVTNKEVNPNRRHQLSKWLHQGYDQRFIDSFIDEQNTFIAFIQSLPPNQLIDPVLNHTLNLQYIQDSESLSTWLDLYTVELSTLGLPYDRIKNAIRQLLNNQISIPLPKIIWNGNKNQFHHWANRLILGDWGISIKDGSPVWNKIIKSLTWTLVISIYALLGSFIISIVLGSFLAIKHKTWIDKSISAILIFIYCMPIFWIGTIAIMYFTKGSTDTILPIFPLGGIYTVHENDGLVLSILKQTSVLSLPVICLMLHDISILTQYIKNQITRQIHAPHVLMAYLKGLDNKTIFKKHILKNAFSPIIPYWIGSIPSIVAGSLIIEVIFNIPGMGRLLYSSIQYGDWNVVYAIIFLTTMVVIFFLLLADIAQVILDKRVKYILE